MKEVDREEMRNWIAWMEQLQQDALSPDDIVDGSEIESWEPDRVDALKRLIAGYPKIQRLVTHHIATPKDKDCDRAKKLIARAIHAQKKRYEIIEKHRSSKVGAGLATFWLSVETDMLRDLAKIFASLQEKYQI